MKIRTCLCLLVASLLASSPGLRGQERTTQNLVLVLIDGYRWQELFRGADSMLLSDKRFNRGDIAARLKKYWAGDAATRRKKLMPFTWEYIALHGQLYGNRDLGNRVDVANPYWISYPGRAEVLSGFVDTAIRSNDYPENPNPNVLEFLNGRQGFKGKVAAIACWDATGRCLHQKTSPLFINVPWDSLAGDRLSPDERLANDMDRYTPRIFGEDERLDANVYALASSYIRARHPRVIYIDFGDPDEYAHAGNYTGYLNDIHHLDGMLRRLWEMLQADPFYRGRTTLAVVPDHGRGKGAQWTDHGAGTPGSGETWLMIMGPDTPASGERKGPSEIRQDQYAATLAGMLGFRYQVPGKTTGAPIPTVSR